MNETIITQQYTSAESLALPYADDTRGEVYIIHLHRKLGHASHYVGFSKKLEKRLHHHRSNTGSDFLRVCNERSIKYTLVVRFAGTKRDERRLKNTNNTARYCPVCNPNPLRFRANVLPHERNYKFVSL